MLLSRSVLVFISLALAACLCTVPGVAQQSNQIKLRDGRSFFYESIQIRNGKVIFRPRGLGVLEVSVAEVLCINEACGGTSQAPSQELLPGKIAIHGSNTIGAALMPALVQTYGETKLQGTVETAFGGLDEQTITIKLPGGENFEVELASKGSGTAFESLASARAVIGMSSRAIKPSEADLLRQQLGVDMLDAASEHVLALDGLAVIVNSTNPLRDVAFNLETIAQIFSGQIANWSQLGGTAAPINVYARDSKSGTFSTFDDMVMKPASLSLAGAAKRFESSDELTDSVENDPNGIGFIGLPYVRNNRALQIGSTCGIAYGPSRFTIQTEVYPLSRRLYLYTPGTPRQGLASDLLNFSMSPEAQPIIRDAGFIDQTVELEDVQQRATWVASLSETADARAPRDMQTQLLDIAGKVTRASVNFRFRSGSSELDNKALSDVRRIARALQNPSFGGQNWFLVGFADSDGSFRTNLNLAFARSQAVAKVLAAQGVQVPNNRIASFSWLAPVACNSDEQGKALNRRVELWFTP